MKLVCIFFILYNKNREGKGQGEFVPPGKGLVSTLAGGAILFSFDKIKGDKIAPSLTVLSIYEKGIKKRWDGGTSHIGGWCKTGLFFILDGAKIFIKYSIEF